MGYYSDEGTHKCGGRTDTSPFFDSEASNHVTISIIQDYEKAGGTRYPHIWPVGVEDQTGMYRGWLGVLRILGLIGFQRRD